MVMLDGESERLLAPGFWPLVDDVCVGVHLGQSTPFLEPRMKVHHETVDIRCPCCAGANQSQLHNKVLPRP